MKDLGILVIDMQQIFINRDKFKQEELIKKQLKLIEFGKKESIPLFVLEYIGYEKTIERLRKPLIDADAFFIDKYNDNAFIIVENPTKDEEHKYIYSLSPIIIDKYFTNVKFCYGEHVKENNLNNILKENNIKNLILTGIHKDSCVLETAEGAKKRGYNIITAEEIIDKKDDSTNDWYIENTKYLKSIEDIFKFIETPRFIKN